MKKCPGVQRRLRDATQSGRFHIAKEFSYSTKQQTGDGWVLIGDAAGFIDPIYSSGVYLALKSAVMASECITEGLHRNDISGETLGRWTGHYDEGVNWIRKLVRTFYTNEFSFAKFIKSHPEHAANLTNLLIGRVFEGSPGKIFDDLDPWVRKDQSRRASTRTISLKIDELSGISFQEPPQQMAEHRVSQLFHCDPYPQPSDIRLMTVCR